MKLRNKRVKQWYRYYQRLENLPVQARTKLPTGRRAARTKPGTFRFYTADYYDRIDRRAQARIWRFAFKTTPRSGRYTALIAQDAFWAHVLMPQMKLVAKNLFGDGLCE